MYHNGFIHQTARRYNYNFIDSVRLINHDNAWHGLTRHYQALKKTTHDPRERFLVQHFDTEYFYNGIGFTTENFITMLRHLDIDPVRFVIMTNHYGSSEYWHSFCSGELNRFHVIESPLTFPILSALQNYFLPPEFYCQYHFVCMMGVMKTHRSLLLKFLHQHNLINNNLITARTNEPDGTEPPEWKNHHDKEFEPKLHYLSTTPFTRINDSWKFDSIMSLLCKIEEPQGIIKNEAIEKIAWRGKGGGNFYDCPWYRNVFADIVTETVYHEPYPFVSEKTIRPIVNYRPFVTLAAPGTLKMLRDFGFKTFGDFWDESYDNEQDPNARFHMVCQQISWISSWSVEECQARLFEMKDTLCHNHANFMSWASDPWYHIDNLDESVLKLNHD